MQFCLILDLPINMSNSIGNFHVSSPHINSSSIYMGNLNLSNQLIGYFFIVKSHKTESSTRLGNRTPNDLALFDIAKLLKMLPKSLIC